MISDMISAVPLYGAYARADRGVGNRAAVAHFSNYGSEYTFPLHKESRKRSLHSDLWPSVAHSLPTHLPARYVLVVLAIYRRGRACRPTEPSVGEELLREADPSPATHAMWTGLKAGYLIYRL